MSSFNILLVLLNLHLIQPDETISPFHLKPLGAHIAATDVDEVSESNMLTPKTFMENYVLPRKPIVLRGVGKKWHAFKKWTDEYLKENYPNLELRMEGKKEKQTPIPQGDIALGRDSMKHFIETYQNTGINKYIVSELPTPLYKYVNIPSPLGCGELKQRFTEIDIWINSGGAKSILHKDSPNTINCVVNGSKEWKLVEFRHNDLIYQAWEGPQEAGYGGYSLINPEKVDVIKFPNILKIPRWYYTHIQAGDCLYLPSQMWHVVHSHGQQNIAVSFLLSQFRDRKISSLDLADCGNEVAPDISLDKIDVDWPYPGYGNMSMGYAELEDYIPEYIVEFFSRKSKILSKKAIFNMLYSRYDGMAHREREAKERTLKLYPLMSEMAPPGQQFHFSMLKNLSRDQLRDISRLIEAHYPAGTTEYEYSYFRPEDIVRICEDVSKEGLLKREDFIKRYLEMNGSLKFAEEFWNKLAGDKDEVMFSDEMVTLDQALEKYEFYREEPLNEDREEEEDDDEHSEGERNAIPESNFVSEPRGRAADFHDRSEENDKQRIERTEL